MVREPGLSLFPPSVRGAGCHSDRSGFSLNESLPSLTHVSFLY